MNNFNFYFELKKGKRVNLNEEKNVVEIELNDLGQGMLFSPQEFQETRFQTLTLPATFWVRKTLLENNIVDRRMVVKDIQKETTLQSVDEKTIKLSANTFGAIEFVNSENENPFDPIKIDWENFSLKKKKGWKSWRAWWNPRDMKFWNPPLTLEEQAKFIIKEDGYQIDDDRRNAWEVYKERFNKQNRKIDLYFEVNKVDKYHFKSSNPDRTIDDRWEIRIFCWPPFTPPSVIEELIPNDSSRRKEFANCVIGEVDLIFDNQNEPNMKLFRQWDNLLSQASPNEKFVIRSIPLQIKETSFHSIDSFEDFREYEWQNELKNESLQQREKYSYMNITPEIKIYETVFRGKVVKRMEIYTKDFKEQLKLEKVSEEEYSKQNSSSNKEKNKLRKNIENNIAWILWIIGSVMLISTLILFFTIRKKTKKVCQII